MRTRVFLLAFTAFLLLLLLAAAVVFVALPQSPGRVVVDETGAVYHRIDPVPGESLGTFRFQQWAGEAYWDEGLQAWVRDACYSVYGGFGCDARYRRIESVNTGSGL